MGSSPIEGTFLFIFILNNTEMISTKKITVGEYIVVIKYNDDGSGHIKVSVLDELQDEIEHIEIVNDDSESEKINPNLN